jgi:hypothetical protein
VFREEKEVKQQKETPREGRGPGPKLETCPPGRTGYNNWIREKGREELIREDTFLLLVSVSCAGKKVGLGLCMI